MNEKKAKRQRTGRLPKQDPAKRKHVFYLNAADEMRFLSLYEQSGKSVMAHFITSCIFDKPLKVVKIDKGVQDYYMRLTTFFGQFRGIANNYNQIVKALHTNFTEKKVLTFLYKLEQATIELAHLNKQVIALTAEFERKYLLNQDNKTNS